MALIAGDWDQLRKGGIRDPSQIKLSADTSHFSSMPKVFCVGGSCWYAACAYRDAF